MSTITVSARSEPEPSPWIRRGLRIVAACAALTGVVGLLHLPIAAPLLRAISPSFVCPIQRGTPAQIDRGHAIGAAAIRRGTEASAPARPALGFVLDASTRADLDAWAKVHGLSCASIAGNETLRRCVDVPALALGEDPALGPLEEATFELTQAGVLVNVQTMRRHLSAADAARVTNALESRAAHALGAPTKEGGAATEAHLAHGVMSSYVAEHAFADYRATVSATNLAPTGVMVREQYLSAR